MSHELYNLGHLYEAAAAHFQATKKKTLLSVAVKSANLVAREFGPGKRTNPPGHEEIEIGLVKLYRVTGTRKYLDLAKFFIDARGKTEGRIPFMLDGKEEILYGEYAQDHKPFIEQTEAVGHAVRAGYLYAGAADVAALTGDAAYVAALEKIWADMAGTKLYITGGIGAAGGWEGYGPPYRLPNLSAYAETCANIATFLWNSRMQRLELDAKYADVMERILYNGVLSGISLSGDRFFYPNPLASFGQHERVPWFSCACCPPNVARILTSVPGYFYAASKDEVYVNLYAQGTGKMKVAGTDLELIQTTDYPWKFDVKIEVKPAREAAFTLALRIPGWALNSPVPTDLYSYLDPPPGDRATLKVNGEDVQVPRELNKGYALIKRTWKAGDVVELSMPMPVRRVVAHEAVEADRGLVAVERGPLVYCAEWTDNDGRVSNLVLPDGAALTAEMRPDLLNGVVVITGEAEAVSREGRQDRQREEAPDAHPVLRLGQPGQGRDGRLAGPRCLKSARRPRARPLGQGRGHGLRGRRQSQTGQRPIRARKLRRRGGLHALVAEEGDVRVDRLHLRSAGARVRGLRLLVRRHGRRRVPRPGLLADPLQNGRGVAPGQGRRRIPHGQGRLEHGQVRPRPDQGPAPRGPAPGGLGGRRPRVEDQVAALWLKPGAPGSARRRGA